MDELAYLWVEVELNDISDVGFYAFGPEFEGTVVVAYFDDLDEAGSVGIIWVA